MLEGLEKVTAQLFQYLAEGCDIQGIEEKDIIQEMNEDKIRLWIREGKVPVFTDDEEIKMYIEKFDLQSPENMVRFFVEGYFETITGIYEGINELKKENLINILGDIQAAIYMVKIGIDNPNRQENKLDAAQDLLLQSKSKLEMHLKSYIDKIKEIDNRSKWQFFLRSVTSLSDIDTNVDCAKQAINALNIIVKMQMGIAMKLNTKIVNSIIIPYLDFVKKTFSKDVCDLMYAYDKNKQDGYWKEIPRRIKATEDIIDTFKEYMDNSQKKITEQRMVSPYEKSQKE